MDQAAIAPDRACVRESERSTGPPALPPEFEVRPGIAEEKAELSQIITALKGASMERRALATRLDEVQHDVSQILALLRFGASRTSSIEPEEAGLAGLRRPANDSAASLSSDGNGGGGDDFRDASGLSGASIAAEWPSAPEASSEHGALSPSLPPPRRARRRSPASASLQPLAEPPAAAQSQQGDAQTGALSQQTGPDGETLSLPLSSFCA